MNGMSPEEHAAMAADFQAMARRLPHIPSAVAAGGATAAGIALASLGDLFNGHADGGEAAQNLGLYLAAPSAAGVAAYLGGQVGNALMSPGERAHADFEQKRAIKQVLGTGLGAAVMGYSNHGDPAHIKEQVGEAMNRQIPLSLSDPEYLKATLKRRRGAQIGGTLGALLAGGPSVLYVLSDHPEQPVQPTA